MSETSPEKQRFVFFTKTSWHEPPRIRHQLAGLLLEAGYRVLFFEKPQFFWRPLGETGTQTPQLSLSRHHELIHHKLRLTRWLHAANARATAESIASAVSKSGVGVHDIIVNFNYEYYFLRDIFRTNHIVTVINDDFVSRALGGYMGPARWALQRTCAASDRILTVSVPLQRQLDAYCKAELFLPWADKEYVEPLSVQRRTHLLFWGYINNRIDFEAAKGVAKILLEHRPQMRLLFVGPVDSSSRAAVDELCSLPNVQIAGPSALDDLPLQSVLAGFIPYRSGVPSIEASTLPNKALQILARGIPLMISGMPNFLEAPFIVRLRDGGLLEQIDWVSREFNRLQPEIRSLVVANGRRARLDQFLDKSF